MWVAAGADAVRNIVTFARREIVRKHILEFFEDNATLVLCALGGAAMTIPVLGCGPLIALMVGFAIGIGVLDRLAGLTT